MTGIVDWAARMREMAEFVGFDREALDLVQLSAPILLRHAEELTSAVYDHFLKFPRTAQFFLTEDGEVDYQRVERRKHTLARWLNNSIEFDTDGYLPGFLLAIGVVHSHPATHRAHFGSVPSRFMIGTMSFAQTAIADLLWQEMDSPEEAARASAAWNKLLMLQLDLLMAGYVTDVPTRPHAPASGPATTLTEVNTGQEESL